MIITADSITLSFLVVAAVTLAVVAVLVWYVYSSRKFRKDIIDLMDDKLSDLLKNIEQPRQETEEEPHDFVVKNITPAEQKEVAEELPNTEIKE